MSTPVEQLLTPKQRLFCDEYLIDMNATRAALKAGYSKGTALSGYLMTLPKIKLYLQGRTDATARKMQVSHDRVLRELCSIAFGNMANYFDDDGKPKPMQDLSADEKAGLLQMQMKENGEMNIKLYNKMAALDRIAKHIGFYKPEIKKPEHVYVYLDRDALCTHDYFDDADLEGKMAYVQETDLQKTEGRKTAGSETDSKLPEAKPDLVIATEWDNDAPVVSSMSVRFDDEGIPLEEDVEPEPVVAGNHLRNVFKIDITQTPAQFLELLKQEKLIKCPPNENSIAREDFGWRGRLKRERENPGRYW